MKNNAFRTKGITAIALSIVFVISAICCVDLSSLAATKWVAVASSDFSAINSAVNNGSLGEVPTYHGLGNAISWSTAVYTDNGNAQMESDALYIPDGYLYMSGYSANDNSGIPIKNLSSFKIDFAFRYKGDTIGGIYSSDSVSSDGSYTFMKIGAYGDVLQNFNDDIFRCTTFTQDANGKTFSYDTTISDGSSDKRIATSGDNIQAGVNYHYIVEYTGSFARAYVTDDNGKVVQEEFNTTDANVLNEFAKGLPYANYFKIGDSKNTQYLRALEYRNIVFYTADIDDSDPKPSTDENKYLFAYFTGNTTDGEKLRFAVSHDGINFAPLNEGKPVTTVDVPDDGEGLEVYPTGTNTSAWSTGHIRDPYVFKAQDGSFYVLATDLSTPEHGFNNNSKMLVWHLDSLADIDSVTPWAIDVTSMFGAGWVYRAWAPEAIWDPVEEQYMLYFAERDDINSATVMYYVYTPDFKTFTTAPKRLVNYGNADNIDGDITYNPDNHLYYLWYKNENTSTLGYATSTTCCGPYTNTTTIQANDGLEGCQVHQLTDGTYILLADAYGAGYFKVYPSSTLDGFSDSNILDSDINFLSPRHGSVVRITTDEFNSLINKFGVRENTDSLEYYFSEGREWGNTNYTSGIKDASGNTYTLGATDGYKTTSGKLELTNGNLFIENEKARNIVKGNAFTLSFTHALTEAYKQTSGYNAITIGNSEEDFVALAEDGTFYVGGVACKKKADMKVGVESSFDIVYYSNTFSLLQDGEYVTGAVFNKTISEASNGSLYVGVGWSDSTLGGRTTGTYSNFKLSPAAYSTGHEDEVIDEYINSFDFDSLTGPAAFNANAYHKSQIASGGYSNVVYSPINTTVFDGNGTENDSYVQIGRMNFKIATPKTMVLVYDGVNEVSYPVVLEHLRQESSDQSQPIHYVCAYGSNSFALIQDWQGYSSDYNLWPKNNIVSSDSFSYRTDVDNESADLNNSNYHFYWNKMVYNGSGDTSKYYEVSSNDSYYVKNSYKQNLASRQYKYGDITSFETRYVINYAPIYKILSGATKVPGTDMGIVEYYQNIVKGNENKYTADSLNQLYITMAAICLSNPNDYDFSATASSVVSCANNIKKAVNEFAKINLVERADFSVLDEKFDFAEELLAQQKESNANYFSSSVNSLIDVLNNAQYHAIDSDIRKNMTKAEAQDAIDLEAKAIADAIDAMNEVSTDVDTTVYNQIVAAAENPDSDVYSCSAEESREILEAALSLVAGADVEYTTQNGDILSVTTIDDSASQTDIDATIADILTYLSTNIRKYNVEIQGDSEVSFSNNGANVQLGENLYNATYNNSAQFRTDNEDTAWYMEYSSQTVSRTKQYQASGAVYNANIIGNITVYAEQRCTATPNKITVVNDFQNDNYTVQQINYVNDTYNLPVKHIIVGYDFVGYFIGDDEVTGTITDIDKDITICARYELKADNQYSVVVKALNGDTLYNKEADEYNTKVSISDTDAYGWVERILGTDEYRPFCIGSELTFFVSESTEIKAVNKTDYENVCASEPNVNIRQNALVTSTFDQGTKTHFTGQLINPAADDIQILEYGYLIGVEGNSLPDESELTVGNSGAGADYRIIRAKSTHLVGSNQFAIGIKNLSGSVIYRGYVVYQVGGTNGKILTSYTACKTQNI